MAKDRGKKEKENGKEGGVAVKMPRSRLRDVYEQTVKPELLKEFGYSTVMQVPTLEKIVVNMGVGEGASDSKAIDRAATDLATITGQKPVITKSRHSISNFRVREGNSVGCKVTLRGEMMYHFFDKLVTVVLPRLRDFQGLSPKSFDGRGNFTVGLKEQLVFPEINYDTFDKIRGMDITICTSARTDDEARSFLLKMGLPLRQK